ncbi:hypothetical protein BD779DRAFT_1509021 [Infundibulicybe gibba]|nr:hypothetical protein BD779DRAFT_1509021 [Infundibulicybe gibba]
MSNASIPGRLGISCIPPEILGEIFIRSLHATVLLHPPLHVICIHLQRSRAHPLTFVLRVRYEDSPELFPVLTALAAARQRYPDILDLIIQGDAPLLRSIRCDIVGLPDPPPVPLRILCCCPRLESFHWKSSGSQLLLPLGDTRLTSLSLEMDLSISEYITVLRLSPRLSSAKFYNLNSPGPSTTPHLTHPTLRSLAIAGEQSAMLLDALTLPALLDLNLATGYALAPFPTWDVQTALRELSLFIPQRPLEPIFQRILNHIPQLRVLIMARRFGYAPLTAMIVRALHPSPPPTPPPCPYLRELELSGLSDCPDGLCTAMLRARWGANAHVNGVACLELAHIEFMNGIHDRDRADMDELCAEGLQGTIYLWD